MKKTKIVATIGPSCSDKKTLKQMIESGLDCIRINTAHGDINQYETIIKNAKSIKDIPILLDVKGPEIRIISERTREIKKGDKIKIDFSPSSIYFNHKFNAKKGQKVLINEGIYEMEIVSLTKYSVEMKANMDVKIENKVRVNIPGIEHDAPILSETDKKVIRTLKKYEIDYLALSYTRNRKDIYYVKRFLRNKKTDIIAKIETFEAVKNFDEILAASEGIMVARGDLGVELSSEKIPLIQKEIIKKCNQEGKLVITATQMLHSMVENPIPTRAETSDVANAILDGTDAVMLSAETSIGKYPVLAVKEMTKIAKEVENTRKNNFVITERSSDISEAISKSIYEMQHILPISKIITFTKTGYTARIISRYRLSKEIYAITSDNSLRKRLDLYYGIRSFVFPEMQTRKRILKVTKEFYKQGLIEKHDLVLFCAGILVTKPGVTNMIEVHKTEDLLSFR